MGLNEAQLVEKRQIRRELPSEHKNSLKILTSKEQCERIRGRKIWVVRLVLEIQKGQEIVLLLMNDHPCAVAYPTSSESSRWALFLLCVIVHRRLGVDDHVLGVVAVNLSIIVSFFRVPC